MIIMIIKQDAVHKRAHARTHIEMKDSSSSCAYTLPEVLQILKIIIAQLKYFKHFYTAIDFKHVICHLQNNIHAYTVQCVYILNHFVGTISSLNFNSNEEGGN